MFIFQLMGGIGNQMFQYAAAKALSIKRGIPFKVHFEDPYKDVVRAYNLAVFNLEVDQATKEDLKLIRPKQGLRKKLSKLFKVKEKAILFREKQYFVYDEQFFNCSDGAYIYGFWQAEQYFSTISDVIREDFRFKIAPSVENALFVEQINRTEAVAVHVRRGDYVSVEKTSTVHGTCSMDYYREAIALMKTQVNNPVFYFFSDDMNWVKQHLLIDAPSVYVDVNDDAHNYEDLRLMTLCKHQIIANSSFSWWGAWLNTNPAKIVVAPEKWANVEGLDTTDLIPKSWIRL